MKNHVLPKLMILFLILIGTSDLNAQNIDIDTTFIENQTIYPFTTSEAISSLKITGNVNLDNDRSIVRVIMVDTGNLEYLLFESYTLIDTLNNFSFSNVCDESCYLDGVVPYSLKVEIIESSIHIDSLTLSTTPIEDVDSLWQQDKYQKVTCKINNINIQTNKKGLRWNAGINPVSLKSYSDKKMICGKFILDYWHAHEYYDTGIYETFKDTSMLGDSIYQSDMPESFDWRNRHGATNPNSPYFHDNKNGWITSLTSQGSSGGCAVFGLVGVIEALVNLYFNDQIHLDLSEQQLASCRLSNDPLSLYEYVTDTGIVNDSAFYPFDENNFWNVPCDTLFNPAERIKCSGYDHVFRFNGTDNDTTFDYLKEKLITCGPLKFCAEWAALQHVLVLVGYKIDTSGLIWILKDSSYGGKYQYYGHAQFMGIPPFPPSPYNIKVVHTPIHSVLTPREILVRDEDGDGYYNWGIGPNPDSTINQTICDCDDSNFTLGPYDSTYHCTPICDSLSYDTVPIVITSDTTWNKPGYRLCKKSVIVETGNTLTISEDMAFLEYVPIIVKPGATLILNDARLTGACNKFWQGIQVWGNKDSSQYALPGLPCPQGKVIINNGSVIENANIAVDLWDVDHYETSGGIVIASDAIFRNNKISIRTAPYQNYIPGNPTVEVDNLSNFENCLFEGSDTIYTTGYLTHAALWGVKGMEFKACDFTTNEIYGIGRWPYAIVAFDAGFKLLPVCNDSTTPCTDYDSCSFDGFYSAITAMTDGSSTNTFIANKAIFNNNTYGARIYGVNNAVVLKSNFKIGPNSTLDTIGCFKAPGVGIHLEDATGFAFEENHFTKYPQAPSGNYIGISIINTESSDEVYKNYFSGLSYANFSDGKNWGKTSTAGLCYFCNENTGNYADFYVDSTGKSGIQSSQGDNNQATGNTFSPIDATWHFYNGGVHLVNYYYCDTCANETPDDNKISEIDKIGISLINSCPSHYSDDIPDDLILDQQKRQSAEQDYYNALNNYNSVKTLYNGLIDGGSTTNELLDIQTAQPQDMWALRAQLLGDSPHLSMEVLKAASDKTEVFTEAALFDILSANPDELKKDELIKYLEEKQDPLPSYMIDILKSLAYGTTYKTTLQQQMARYNRIKSRAAHDIIRSNLNNSVSNKVELRNWLDNLGGLSSDRQIITSYVSEGDFTSAYTLSNMLPQLYGLQGDDLTDHNYYMDIISLHDTLQKQGRNIAQLDSTEVSNLMVIANNSSGIAGRYAKNILEYSYGCHYFNCPNLSGSVAFKNRKVNLNSLNEVYGISISAKPNPARQWAAFDYTLSNDDARGIITIRDISGKIIQELHVNGKQGQILLDIRQIKPGVYFYTLLSEGFSKSDKIVISE